MKLFDHRLLVVAGKGGVGRTTAAATLGLVAAQQGKRVAIVELSGQTNLARAFGAPPSYAPNHVAPSVDVLSLSPGACVADFGQRKLKMRALSRMFFNSRLMTGFIESVPGLQDLVQLGKIENMLMEPLPGEPVYDLVVLDGPATGHGLTLLAAARAMREMTAVGPFHDLAAIIEALLEDHDRTGTVLVTLPEALPVQEGLELAASLAEERTPPCLVVVNQARPAWPDAVPREVVRQALSTGEAAAAGWPAIAEDAIARHDAQHEARAHLLAGLQAHAMGAVPVVSLPKRIGAYDVRALAAALHDALPEDA